MDLPTYFMTLARIDKMVMDEIHNAPKMQMNIYKIEEIKDVVNEFYAKMKEENE